MMNWIIASLIVIGLLAGCSGEEDKFTREVTKETEAVKLARETVTGGYELLTVADLKSLQDKGTDMVIVDTMPFESSYVKEHVPGALHFVFPIAPMSRWELKETGNKTEDDYRKLLGPDTDKLVVVYCGFVKCGRSDNGAVWARKLGYTNVKRLPGGIFAWKGAGYPVATGDQKDRK